MARRKARRRGVLSQLEASFGPAPKSVVRKAHRHTAARLRPLRSRVSGRFLKGGR